MTWHKRTILYCQKCSHIMADELGNFQHPQWFMHLSKLLAPSTDLNIELCDSTILVSFDCVSFPMWLNSPIFTIAIPVSSQTWGRRNNFSVVKLSWWSLWEMAFSQHHAEFLYLASVRQGCHFKTCLQATYAWDV